MPNNTIYEPFYAVDTFGEIVDSMTFEKVNPLYTGNPPVYKYGRILQIVDELQKVNSGDGDVNNKYPLIALFFDFSEDWLDATVEIIFPKITIATLTEKSDNVEDRYTKTFKPILYPIYQSLLISIAKHKQVVLNDWKAIQHTKVDRPGSSPVIGNPNEYLDSIEILNLRIPFYQKTNC